MSTPKPSTIASRFTKPLAKIGITVVPGSKVDSFIKKGATLAHTGLVKANDLSAQGEKAINDLKARVHSATAPSPEPEVTPKPKAKAKARRPADMSR